MDNKNSTYASEEITTVSGAALKVSLGGLLTLLMGFGVQVVTAFFYGAGAEMDAFLTASIIPLYFQLVLLSSLPFVVIPAFVEHESRGRLDDAWALVGTCLWVISGIFSLIAIAGSLSSMGLISIIAPGFNLDKAAIASQMLGILMLGIPFMGIAYLTSGIQNVQNRWFWPAAAAAIGSTGNLLTLLLFHKSLGVMALAWGGLAAAIIQALITAIPVLRPALKRSLPLSSPYVRELGRLITPFIVFGFLICSKYILERFFASRLPDGDLSYIGYGSKIANIFVTLLASSIAAAIFPSMARAYSKNGVPGLAQEADFGLKITLALALPAVTITSALSIPLVTTFFERGAFSPVATTSVSLIIPVLMVNEVLFRMVTNIFSRTYYILKDTLIVNLIQSLTVILYIAAAVDLTKRWGYFGLALAQLAQSGPAMVILGWLLIKRLKTFPITQLLHRFVLYSLASLATAALSRGMVEILAPSQPFVQLTAGLIAAGTTYLAILGLLDRETAHLFLQIAGIDRLFKLCQQKLKLIFQS